MIRFDWKKYPLEVQNAAHMIGLTREKTYNRHGKEFFRPYRNYFQAANGTPDYYSFLSMVEDERAVFRNGQNDTTWFFLTRKGFDWLGDELGIYIFDEEK